MAERDIPASGSRARGAARRAVAIAIVGLIVLGIAALLASRMLGTPARSRDDGPRYGPPAPPVALPAAFVAAAEGHVAQGLGLTERQIADRLPPDGKGMVEVADAQGVSPEHWYALELAALRTAGERMVTDGVWTREQADAVLAYWQQRGAAFINGDFTGWFRSR
ncbi:MAG TPA: hypothetical protein VFW96_12680 [Thermomicrobiales bacterium]|nr:hypothetical protein [Thermomicrobiales bacterium]